MQASPPHRSGLVLAAAADATGARTDLLAAVRRGELVRIRRGIYAASEVWEAAAGDERHRWRARAAALALGGHTVFSHQTAVALWRLPWVGHWPDAVHALGVAADGGRSNATVRRHAPGPEPDWESVDGLRVTSLARTVVDVARTSGFGPAVAVADAALRRAAHPEPGAPRVSIEQADLRRELAAVPVKHGSARARAVVEFSDGAAQLPGESLSRVSMLRAGIPAPELQCTLVGASGREWTVDFFWRRYNLIGEFDGRWKYTDPRYLAGRTPEQVLLDEKAREGDLRDAGYRLTRWMWAVAVSPERLRAKLEAAGLR